MYGGSRKERKKEMKKKAFICTCAASLLICNCVTAAPVFAADYSFIQKVENLQYDAEFQAELAEEEAIKAGKADTSWFDPDDPKEVYEITTEQQLFGLAKLVRTRKIEWKVNEVYTFKGVTFKLMNDIALTKNWIPIGNSEVHLFEGVFDGNGHTISGIKINGSQEDNQGFFGYLAGTVNNLNLSGSINTYGSNIGGMAGTMTSSAVVENCTVNIEVSGTDKIGGVVGESNSGQVINCHNQGSVKGNVKVGGVVGENWNGRIEQCSNEGTVVSKGKGVGTYGTGGIAGRSVAKSAMIKESFNRGNIHSGNECAGGVVGYTNAVGSTVESCYNTGSVSGPEDGSYGYVGGVVGSIGEDGVKLRNSYNAGTLKNGKYIGGILGNYTADYYNDIGRSISNNYYLNNSAKAAVGKDREGKGKKRYSKTIVPMSSGDMRSTHMASDLGNAYRPDTSGMYGMNNGYPVFIWQENETIDRNAILKKMRIGYKDSFQKFFEENLYGTASGEFIIEMFNPHVYIENMFSELKDKAEDMK